MERTVADAALVKVLDELGGLDVECGGKLEQSL
jgi:hypothetical protein